MKASRNVYRLSLIAAASLVSLAAQANCALPPPPSKIPDGASASEQEMLAAMQTLKRYDADVNTYVKCLEFEAKQNRISKDEQLKQHNAAIQGLESIATKFNAQVRIYKSRTG